MSEKTWDPESGRARLLALIRERAYSEGPEFTLASGKKSTFYVDGKQVTLDAEGLWLLSHLIVDTLRDRNITAIGGLTMGADPIAAGASLVSHEEGLDWKAFLVRKEAKGHGKQKKVEGKIDASDRICIVEDVVTTGGSAKKAMQAIEEIGCPIEAILTVVDREDEDADWLRSHPGYTPLFRISEIRGD